MLAARIRSGLVETIHDGALAIFDGGLRLIAWTGDIDRPFFLRSSAKPFQAVVAQEAGALLGPLEIALSAASHDGQPIHVAIVQSMLESAGLSQDDLRCPPDWPLSRSARDLLVGVGHKSKRRIWHNCSGKHASWLRACAAQGWPLDTYLHPDHPFQRRIRRLVSDIGGYPADPVGVDGCGAPVLRTTIRAMAVMFARLATDSRFSDVYSAMHTYPALASGVGHGDAGIAIAIDAVAKRGAEGCLGVAVRDQWGVAVKSWDGDDEVAAMAAATGLGLVNPHPRAVAAALAPITDPPVYGGGDVVGYCESRLELRRT